MNPIENAALARFAVDAVEDGLVQGWCFDVLKPGLRGNAKLRFGDAVVAEGIADRLRGDLAHAGIGDGRHAFSLPLQLSPMIFEHTVECVLNGRVVPMADADPIQATLLLRAAAVAEYGRHVALSPMQVDNETAVIGIELDGELTSPMIDGLQLEMRIIGGQTQRMQLSPGLQTSVQVELPEGGQHEGSLAVEVDLLTVDGQAYRLAAFDLPWARRAAALTGAVDGVLDGRLVGWVVDEAQPGRPVSLRILIDDQPVAETLADQQPPTLTGKLPDRIRWQFSVAVPSHLLDGQSHAVTLFCLDSSICVPLATDEYVLQRPAVPDRLRPVRGALILEAQAPSVDKRALALFPSGSIEVAADLWPRLNTARLRRRWPTVVMPVYNAFDDVVESVNALLEHRAPEVPIVFIDDGSTDARIGPFLAQAATRPGCVLVTHSTNLGYTEAVNRGIASCAGDIVLLNSDTRVTPGWLGHLVDATAEHPRVGTVTAISNHAGVFSVPEPMKDNRLPLAWGDDLIGRAFAYASGTPLPVGTGNGFCMWIARELIAEIGAFDAAAFPRGYGEENDFAMRALAAGWRHLVTDAAFVFHRRSASFNEVGGRDKIYAASQQRLLADHPYYVSYVRGITDNSTQSKLSQPKRALVAALNCATGRAALQPHLKPRVLIMLHFLREGGTAMTTLDLCRQLTTAWEVFLFHPEDDGFQLSYFNPRSAAIETLFSTRVGAPSSFTDLWNEAYANLLSEVLVRWRISLVHIRHLMHHPRLAPRVIRSLGLPYLLSLHDFYAVCPTVNLINAEGRYCAADCRGGAGDCASAGQWPADLGRLRGEGITVWRKAWAEVVEHAHAVITTSPYAASIFERSFGTALAAPVHVIEHGRAFEQQQLAEPPVEGQRVRIAVLGNLWPRSKGLTFVRELARIDRGRRLEFHFLGLAPDDALQIGTVHGRYERDQLAEMMAQVKPAFVGIFSIWPETYCHTLSEAWALGIPVIASELGATGERVQTHGGGITIDPTDAPGTYRRILDAAQPQRYPELQAGALASHMRTSDAMGADYLDLYAAALGAAMPARLSQDKSPTVALVLQAWLSAASLPAQGTVADAAVCRHARRVGRWSERWQPRAPVAGHQVLTIGTGDLPPDGLRLPGARRQGFDARLELQALATTMRPGEAAAALPTLFTSLIDRLNQELRRSDVIWVSEGDDPAVALAACAAADGQGLPIVVVNDKVVAEPPAGLACYVNAATHERWLEACTRLELKPLSAL